MPIQYSPFPEFQAPNINFLGALAQGQASRLQELQAQKLAQQTAATVTKEEREADKFRAEQEKLNYELSAKKYDSLIDMVPRLNEKNYGAWYKQVSDVFPLAAATLPPAYDQEAVKFLGLKGADLKDQVLQQHYGDTTRFVRIGAKGGAEVVPGSEVTAPSYIEAGGEVYRKTPQGLVPAPIISGEGMPSARQDLTTDLIKQREGFISKPEYDVNAYRAGYGSDTVTRADGSVERVKPGMSVSREDAERDLQRRIQTEFVPKAAAKVGEENWSRLPENTRAALTSIAYNYGNIPNRIVPAVQSGNPEAIAKAIESLAGDNKGVNAGRRMQEANIARGTGLPGSQAVPAFAAGGLPTFMGGPQIQPPINMMGAAPVNAMAAPQPLPVAPAMPIPTPQPVTVGTKKQVVGQSNVENTLGRMTTLYEKLDEMKEIPSEKRGPLENIGAYARGTTLGQEVEKARATPAQTKRNEIRSLQRALLNDIKNSTGMSAQEINSNFELKNMLETLSDPTQSIESVKAILADISARYGKGKIAMPAEAAAPSSERPPLSSFFKR